LGRLDSKGCLLVPNQRVACTAERSDQKFKSFRSAFDGTWTRSALTAEVNSPWPEVALGKRHSRDAGRPRILLEGPFGTVCLIAGGFGLLSVGRVPVWAQP
jgi:hypothetical protein